ncbi:MAG: TIGR00730 family Rossman fold protein [Bacteroidota bacterium]
MIKTVCVFCGSGTGGNEDYSTKAEYLGLFLTERNIGLVYGGANVGLMRVIADTMIGCGGEVTGVMPVALVEREVAHDNLTEMHIVSDMQERKSLMAKLSDAFIAMPGGYGTFDEIFEVLTWNQLGIIQKPIGLLNVNGYYNPLLEMMDRAVEEKFLRPEHRADLLVDEDVDLLWEKLNSYQPVTAQKWIEGLKAGKI